MKKVEFYSQQFIVGKILKATLDTKFFSSTRSVGRSKTFSNMREVSGRFHLLPGEYVIIPSTFKPGIEAAFLLRAFTEKKYI